MSPAPILPRTFSDQAVKAQYARVAWFYDGWSRLTEEKALQRLLTLTEVNDGMQILEVAVGTGRLFAQLVRQNPAGMTEGIDLSPAMLRHAQRRLGRSIRPACYRLQEGSAYQLPYTPGQFDRIFNAFMLDLFPSEDFARVLTEFMRLLKPGGRLALAYFSHGNKWSNRIWPWLAKHLPALLTGCRPVALESALQQAGFQILAQESISQNTFPSTVVIAKKPT